MCRSFRNNNRISFYFAFHVEEIKSPIEMSALSQSISFSFRSRCSQRATTHLADKEIGWMRLLLEVGGLCGKEPKRKDGSYSTNIGHGRVLRPTLVVKNKAAAALKQWR